MTDLTGRFRNAARHAGLSYTEALAVAEREWLRDALAKAGLDETAPLHLRQLPGLAEHLGLSLIEAVADARLAWVLRVETRIARDEALSFAG